jgi:hypothetical protein
MCARPAPDSRTALALLVAALVVTTTLPAPAAAAVSGRPDIAVTLPDDTVRPGAETTLDLTLTNDAVVDQLAPSNPSLTAEVTTAGGVTVTAEAPDAPLSVETGERAIGSIADGAQATAPVDVRVNEDATPGTYEMDVEVEYTHATTVSERLGVVNRRTVTRHYDVEVTVEESDVRFRVVDVEASVLRGESGRVAVTVAQAGTRRARDVTMGLRSLDAAVSPAGAPASGQASRYVGDWGPGERRTLTYRVTASAAATADDHALELVPSYEDADGDAFTGTALSVGVTPVARDRFAVDDPASTVTVGSEATLGIDLTNDGPGAADSVRVSVTATSPALQVDGGTASEAAVGRVGTGGSDTARFAVRATEAASAGTHTLSATLTYTDPTGATVTTAPRPVRVRVVSAPTFAVSGVNSSLYVGERGRFTGRVRNTGAVQARSAVLRVTESPAGVRFTEPAVPLGDLGPDGVTAFSLPARVPAETTSGARAVTAVVEYELADGTVRRSDLVRLTAPVAPERDTFRVEPVDATFAPDSTGRLAVRITNVGDEPRTDVQAAIRPTEPFTSVAPSAYVGRLAPGESATVAFAVEVDEDAVATRDALALNVTADTDAGLAEVERHLVPVNVATEETPVDIVPLAVLGVLTLAILGAVGWWWYGRR